MATIKLRRGTSSEWFAVNPVLADGEVGIESSPGTLPDKGKIGDGSTAWNSLPYSITSDWVSLAEKGVADGVASLDGSATVPDAQIPATIARDTEVTAAIASLNGTYVPTLTQTQTDRALRDPNMGAGRLLPVPTVHSAPPVVTVGVANAASTIGSSVLLAASDSAFRYFGAGMVAGTAGGYAVMDSGYLTTPNPVYVGRAEFMTDDNFEFQINPTGNGTVGKWRLWVDGQLATAAPQTGLASGGANYKVLVDWGGRPSTPKRVMIEWVNAHFSGLFVGPTTTVWKSSRPVGPKVVVIGDSFGEGSGGNWWWDGWPMKMGELLGWGNVIPSVVGSTGYLADGGGGGKVKYRTRLAADVTALSPDVVIVSGGYNDSVSTPAAVLAEATLLYAAIIAAMPAAHLLVVGPFWPVGVSITGTPTLLRDAIQTAAAAADVFIDPIAYPTNTSWITGSGYVGATNGSGNSDYYTGSDAVHPAQAGHTFLGRRVASALAALMPVAT